MVTDVDLVELATEAGRKSLILGRLTVVNNLAEFRFKLKLQ